jgi:hypothetical protein
VKRVRFVTDPNRKHVGVELDYVFGTARFMARRQPHTDDLSFDAELHARGSAPHGTRLEALADFLYSGVAAYLARGRL